MAYSVFIHNFFEFFFSVNSSVPNILVVDIAIDRCVVDKLKPYLEPLFYLLQCLKLTLRNM